MEELWKDTAEFPGYQVSSLGNVRGRRVTGHRIGTRGGICQLDDRWHLLTPQSNKRGYHILRLRKDGRYRKVKVHQLVLEAFSGPRPPGMGSRHLNDIRSDNRLDNLEWGTQADNAADCKRNGNLYVAKGESNARSKLTEDEVLSILRRHATGETQTSLASQFGVTLAAVNAICRRKRWKHITTGVY